MARVPAVIFRAEFWAEDLSEFFFAALALGPSSMVTPVWGYHMLISRILAFIATFFPVVAAPFIYAISCLLLNTLTMAYFSRDGFSYIIKSRAMRILLCALLAVAPGSAEIFLNLCNLTTVLTLLGVLLLLERPFCPSVPKIIALFFIAFSAGQFFLFIPLVFYLFYLSGKRRYLGIALIMLLPMILNYLNVSDPSSIAAQAGLLNFSNLHTAPSVLLDNFFLRLFYLPIFGRATRAFMVMPAEIFWPTSILFLSLFLLLILLVFRNKNKIPANISKHWIWPLVCCYCCAIFTFAVIAVVRNFPILRINGETYYHSRYSFLPAVFATILWTALLLSFKTHAIGAQATKYALLFLLAYHIVINFNVVYLRPDLAWPKQAQKVQKALDAKNAHRLKEKISINVLSHPSGCNFDITVIP